MFETEQEILDKHNARAPNVAPYRLMRLSKSHPTAHIALEGEMYTNCGIRLLQGFEKSAEAATRLCDRCKNIIKRRLS